MTFNYLLPQLATFFFNRNFVKMDLFTRLSTFYIREYILYTRVFLTRSVIVAWVSFILNTNFSILKKVDEI